MDVENTSGPYGYVLRISQSEILDIIELVEMFRRWELLENGMNTNAIAFILAFSTDCKKTLMGYQPAKYAIVDGVVALTRDELASLGLFMKIFVEIHASEMSWMKRTYLKMASKTIMNRLGM